MDFLFRFRDLVASTIDRHNEIIATHGVCWWGWWKRPSENSRVDVWKVLKNASLANPITVGLFDSGSGKVYKAIVVAAIHPEHDAEDTLPIPNDEKHLVPDYYRDSPFSRAWLKIKNINSIDFFGEYSFAEAPTLPNYSKATLQRLEGKKIVNADELRSMDTTIWRIRPARADDPAEQIILSVQAIPSAVSREVVLCKADTILHLTDLHFSVGSHREQHAWRLESENSTGQATMVEAIKVALDNRKIGLVIVSGDFTYLGSEAEFDEAAAALSLLLGNLDLSADQLVIVPGNHDIQWATDETYKPGSKVDRAPNLACQHYEKFYKKIMRHEPHRNLAMGRRYVLPSGMVVEICGLNSSSLMTGKNYLAGTGRIDENAFSGVANELGWTSSQSIALRILAIHHHLALTEDLESPDDFSRGYGLAIDAVRVQRVAASKGVHLALHGHKHRAFIWRSSVYALPEETQPTHYLGDLSIVGGGSAGSSEVPGDKNYFNVLTCQPKGITLEILRAPSAGAFTSMAKWEADFSLQEGRLRLGDWKV